MQHGIAAPRRVVASIVAASSGNLVEWFDFYVYAFSAVYLGPVFFPKSVPTVQLLYTAGVFGAGFLMRPVGGWLFGRIADRRGRRTSLVVSVMLMCAGSLSIALIPGYASIGEWAPRGLLVARLVQGLSVGGEYGATATYLSEIAPAGRRGLMSSYQYVTLIGGQLLAVLCIALLQAGLGDAGMQAGGWRLPFAFGALTALAALLLRRTLLETAGAAAPADAAAGSLALLFGRHRGAFFTVLGFTAGGSLAFYTFTTYMQKYLVNSAHMSIATATHVMTVCLLLYMGMQPLFGALSDRIGRRTCMLCFSGLLAAGTVPLMRAMQAVHGPVAAGALVVLALAALSFYTSIAAIVKAELFPPQVRALGVGLAYAVGNAVFGGSAESAALWLKSIGHESAFYWYVTALMLVGFAVSARLPRRGAGYLP